MQMVECTALMDRVRWIKTDEEVALIRRAPTCSTTLISSFQAHQARRYRTQSARGHHRHLSATWVRMGARHFQRFQECRAYAGESDVVLEKGDAIRTDYVAYLQSYPGHQSRNVIVGPASAEQNAITRSPSRSTARRSIAAASARNVHDLWQATMNDFKKAGWADNHMLIGHSVGPWWHQQEPILRRKGEHVLEAGMVLAPRAAREFLARAGHGAGDDGAPELLSAKFNTDEPFIAG